MAPVASAQVFLPAPAQQQLQPQPQLSTQEPALRSHPDDRPVVKPGQLLVTRRDTLVTTKRDTLIVEKKDTAYVTRYDVVPTVALEGSEASVPVALTDSVIARAVQVGVLQALRQQELLTTEIAPRPDYLKTWDKMQDKRKIRRVDRDLMRAVFVPKGQWLVGASFNYQEWDTENMNLLVLKNMNFEGYTFSGSPYLGYFIKNNIAVGARYNYHRNYLSLGQFDLNLGEDFNVSLSDLYYLGQTHEASAFVRTYMSLGRANIFGFFSEIRGTYAYSEGKNTTGTGAELEGSYSKGHDIQLTFCPGMSAFVTDFLAAEASIGVLGLKYGWKDQHTNRVETGKSHSGGANFRFNFLSISLGLTFYL